MEPTKWGVAKYASFKSVECFESGPADLIRPKG